jgi:Family of unknown function (DUF6111)
MSRILFTYILPFLLPAAVYAAWVWYRTGYVARHGGEAPRLERGPWPLLMFLGAVLAFAVLAVTALTRGGSPDETYVPPHLENGAMIPGHLEPKKP